MQPAEWQVRMRQALISAVSEDDIRAIMEGIVEKAKRGDREAIKIVLSYVGQPAPPPTTHLRVSAQAGGGSRNGKKPKEVGYDMNGAVLEGE